MSVKKAAVSDTCSESGQPAQPAEEAEDEGALKKKQKLEDADGETFLSEHGESRHWYFDGCSGDSSVEDESTPSEAAEAEEAAAVVTALPSSSEEGEEEDEEVVVGRTTEGDSVARPLVLALESKSTPSSRPKEDDSSSKRCQRAAVVELRDRGYRVATAAPTVGIKLRALRNDTGDDERVAVAFHELRSRKQQGPTLAGGAQIMPENDDEVALRPYGSASCRAVFASLDQGEVPESLEAWCDEDVLEVEVVDRRQNKVHRQLLMAKLSDHAKASRLAARRLHDDADSENGVDCADALRDAFAAAMGLGDEEKAWADYERNEEEAVRAEVAARRAMEKNADRAGRHALREAQAHVANATTLVNETTAQVAAPFLPASGYRVLHREGDEQRPSEVAAAAESATHAAGPAGPSTVAICSSSCLPKRGNADNVTLDAASRKMARRVAASMRLERELQRRRLPVVLSPAPPTETGKPPADPASKKSKPKSPQTSNARIRTPYLPGGPTYAEPATSASSSDVPRVDATKSKLLKQLLDTDKSTEEDYDFSLPPMANHHIEEQPRAWYPSMRGLPRLDVAENTESDIGTISLEQSRQSVSRLQAVIAPFHEQNRKPWSAALLDDESIKVADDQQDDNSEDKGESVDLLELFAKFFDQPANESSNRQKEPPSPQENEFAWFSDDEDGCGHLFSSRRSQPACPYPLNSIPQLGEPRVRPPPAPAPIPANTQPPHGAQPQGQPQEVAPFFQFQPNRLASIQPPTLSATAVPSYEVAELPFSQQVPAHPLNATPHPLHFRQQQNPRFAAQAAQLQPPAPVPLAQILLPKSQPTSTLQSGIATSTSHTLPPQQQPRPLPPE